MQAFPSFEQNYRVFHDRERDRRHSERLRNWRIAGSTDTTMWATARRMGAALAGAALLGSKLAGIPNLTRTNPPASESGPPGAETDSTRTDLATPALAADDVVDIEGQSTFVTEDKSLAFGFTVESIHDDDIYFSIRVPTDRSWGAVGLGSNVMNGSLVLMIYVRLLFPSP